MTFFNKALCGVAPRSFFFFCVCILSLQWVCERSFWASKQARRAAFTAFQIQRLVQNSWDFSSMSFWLYFVTLNALCDEMNWRCPGESLKHHSLRSTSCHPPPLIRSAPSWPLTTTTIFQFNITWDIQTPKRGHLTHFTILETGICLWRASVVVWLLFGCTPEAVWVDWCERVQGESQAQGRWTTELTTLG